MVRTASNAKSDQDRCQDGLNCETRGFASDAIASLDAFAGLRRLKVDRSATAPEHVDRPTTKGIRVIAASSSEVVKKNQTDA